MINKTTVLAITFLSTLFALGADAPTSSSDTSVAPTPAPAPRTGTAMTRGGRMGGVAGARGTFQGRGGGMAVSNPSGGVLDQEQMDLLRQSLQKDNEQFRTLEEKLRAAQKELVQACVAATYDEKVVREKSEAVAKIQVDITMLRAQSVAVVAPTLKPEQKDKIADSNFAISTRNATSAGP